MTRADQLRFKGRRARRASAPAGEKARARAPYPPAPRSALTHHSKAVSTGASAGRGLARERGLAAVALLGAGLHLAAHRVALGHRERRARRCAASVALLAASRSPLQLVAVLVGLLADLGHVVLGLLLVGEGLLLARAELLLPIGELAGALSLGLAAGLAEVVERRLEIRVILIPRRLALLFLVRLDPVHRGAGVELAERDLPLFLCLGELAGEGDRLALREDERSADDADDQEPGEGEADPRARLLLPGASRLLLPLLLAHRLVQDVELFRHLGHRRAIARLEREPALEHVLDELASRARHERERGVGDRARRAELLRGGEVVAIARRLAREEVAPDERHQERRREAIRVHLLTERIRAGKAGEHGELLGRSVKRGPGDRSSGASTSSAATAEVEQDRVHESSAEAGEEDVLRLDVLMTESPRRGAASSPRGDGRGRRRAPSASVIVPRSRRSASVSP